MTGGVTSGNAMLVLAETDRTAPRALPPSDDLAALHAAIVAEVEGGLGPAHAAIFARPVPGPDRVVWQAPGENARGLLGLRMEDRRALLLAAGSILSDIRRLGESGRAPAVAAVWPHLRAVPGPEAVFAVDGRPILAPWGYAPAPGSGDVLAAYDDGVAFQAPMRTDWRPYAASLAGVAMLAVLAGFALPALARWAIPAPAQCRADSSELDLMRRQADAQSRGAELQRLLASLTDEVGRRQLMCPLRTAQARPVTPPPPPPHAALPEQQWDARDLSMLDGCWHNTTPLKIRMIESGRVLDVNEWKLCFDRSGNGRQSIRFDDGVACTGPLAAAFQGDQLLLTDRERCGSRNFHLMRGKMECVRINSDEATCTRSDLEGPSMGTHQTGRFMR